VSDRQNIFLAVIGLFILAFFIFLASIIKEPVITDLDIRISRAFSFWRPVWLTTTFKFITAFGSFAIAGLLAIVFSAILWQRHKRVEAIFLMISIASVLMIDPLKSLISRPRPDAAIIGFVPIEMGGFSFPSGHSVLSSSVYGFLLVIIIIDLRGRLRIAAASFLLVSIILIGLSRIYLGAHYLSDVIGGLLLGSAWCVFLTILFFYILKKKDHGHFQ